LEQHQWFWIEQPSPVVAIYTGSGHGKQTQSLAYSTDRGTHPGQVPRESGQRHLRARTFCDPKFVWHAPRRQSVMIVALADLPYESRLFVDRRQAWFPHFPSAEAAGMQTGG
jgi:sucrose-6-phosphate hydrolase SacC (GH32 family)